MKETKGGEGMTVNGWIKKHTDSLSGKTVAISGSTGGLGKALCEHLARLGAERLILLDRNAGKAETLKSVLQAQYPALQVCIILTDLADMQSV